MTFISSNPAERSYKMKDYYGKDASALLSKKLYLLDMDGTIYLGNNLFEGIIKRNTANGFNIFNG